MLVAFPYVVRWLYMLRGLLPGRKGPWGDRIRGVGAVVGSTADVLTFLSLMSGVVLSRPFPAAVHYGALSSVGATSGVLFYSMLMPWVQNLSVKTLTQMPLFAATYVPSQSSLVLSPKMY